MKNLLIVLVSGLLLLSCEDSRNNSLEDFQKEVQRNTSKFIQSNPEEAINSLKYVILKEDRYYLDETNARKANTNEKIIEKLKKDISDVNKALDERAKFIQENKKNIKEYQLELIDFQKIDLDSLKKAYYNKNNSISSISGDLSTTSQNQRIITVYNPSYTKVTFRGQGRTALISFHTFGASSTFGGWQYKDGTGSFATPITRDISLYTNNDDLRLSYKTSDPEGGICGYTLN